MKRIKHNAALTVLVFLASALTVLADPVPTIDDFNDGSKDLSLWGDDIPIKGSTGFLTETNGHLEFTGSDSGIIRPWRAGFGSYTQNWEVAVDIHVGAVAMPQDSGLEMFLAIANAAEAMVENLEDHLSISLGLEGSFGSTYRWYSTSAAVTNMDLTDFPNCAEISTGDQQGRLRIAFDASTKTLAASYNGNPLGSLDVDAPETDWVVTSPGFLVALGGSMWGALTNSGSEVYADNFEIRTGDNLTYLLTVNNGTGGGSFTNHASVNITASNAPSGQVFDHWAGSTQYLASVTSAATTVTMPSQAISLTPAYKPSGTASGDDFNDGSKDLSLWGDDIYIMSTNANLLEVNGRVEFAKGSDVEGNNAYRPWIYSIGSYTQNWEISADAHLGNVTLPMDGEWVSMGLTVINRQDTNLLAGVPAGDALRVSLDLYSSDGAMQRGYEMLSWVDLNGLADVPNYGYVSTGDTDGRVKISFDASTKVLTASYNGNVLGRLDVDAPGSNWEMNDGATFGIAIVGSAGAFAVSVPAGEVYADNFEVTGTVPPPADGDGNGLPDWWEQQHFGLPGNTDPNAICSNGVNTVLEAYLAGLDPNDPEAFFGITGGDAKNRTLQWNAVSGRLYNVYYTTNLLNGFQPLMTNYSGGAITDSLRSAEGKCFYKIDVRLP